MRSKGTSVFSYAEIAKFIADGFVIVRRAFSPEIAARGRDFIWTRILSWNDCTTSDQPMVYLQQSFSADPFDQVMNIRLARAFDELLGKDRWTFNRSFGWWPVLLPGFPGPGGWHVDRTFFRHHLTSREQGLVTLFLFSDMGAGDGGTPIVRGSHHAVARLLAQAEPAGLSLEELKAKLPEVDLAEVVELTGEAGDVALFHPFAIHGFGPNRGSRIRFACNPLVQLKEPMILERADAAHSPVEKAIRRAIGKSPGDRVVASNP
jgi:uncharacterized protein (DUF433 family)